MSLSWQTLFAGPSHIGYHPYFSVASVDGQISEREKRYIYFNIASHHHMIKQ
jgi:hypothetical protein